MRPQRGPSRQRALPARCRQCSDLRRWWWACQDLNLGPHPHQVSRAQRCADRRFPRSLATVRGQGMRSNNLVRTGARTRCRGLRARYAHNPSPARRSDRDGGQAACPTRALRPARLAASTASPPASARTAARTPSEARSHPGCPLDLVGAGAGSWAGVPLGMEKRSRAGCRRRAASEVVCSCAPARRDETARLSTFAKPASTGNTSTAALQAPAGRPGPWSTDSLVRRGDCARTPPLGVRWAAAGRPCLRRWPGPGRRRSCRPVHGRQHGPEHQCACEFGHGCLRSIN
jgi:hypothetical protein